MPNIRVIAPEKWDVHPSEEGAAAYERVGRYIGQAFKEVGSEVQGTVDTMAQNQARSTQMNMQADLSQFQVEAHQNLSQYLSTAKPDDPDALTKWNKDYFQPGLQALNQKYSQTGTGDSVLDAVTGNKYHDQLMDTFSRQTNAIQSSVMDRATGEWADIQGRYYVQKADETTANHAALGHDDPASYPALIQQNDAFLSSVPFHDAAQRETAIREGRARITDSTLDGIVAKAEDPNHTTPEAIQNALSVIQDPKAGFYSNASPGKYDMTVDRLQKTAATYGEVPTILAESQMPSIIKGIEAGNPDALASAQSFMANIKAASPQKAAELQGKYGTQIEEAQGVYAATQSYRDMPTPALQSILDNSQQHLAGASAETLPFEEAKIKGAQEFLTKRNQEFKSEGGAQFAINHSPSVASREQAFLQNPSPQAWQNYSQFSQAYQRQIYPDQTPRLLTKDMVATITDQIRQIPDGPDGAAKTASFLNQFSQAMGPQWPQVSQELFQAHAMNEQQYLAASLWSNPASRGIAQDVLHMSTMSDKDIQAASEQPGHKSLVQAQQDAADALQPFRTAMSYQGDGPKIYSAYESTLTKLIQYKGGSVDAAALAGQLINNEYHFSGSLMIPSSYDQSSVVAGTRNVSGDLANHNLVVPSSLSGAGPADQRAEFIRDVQQSGRWVMTGDNRGAMLTTERGDPVYETIKGQKRPLVIDFQTLSKLGR
jgi:hypothetical protein